MFSFCGLQALIDTVLLEIDGDGGGLKDGLLTNGKS